MSTINRAANFVDALALPQREADLLVYLTRHGAADAASLSAALGDEIADVEVALANLEQAGRVRRDATGRARIVLGRSRPRTVPAELWRGLMSSARQYSAQEIATLRAVIPMLQFARAKLGEFSDHGPSHAMRVRSFASQLGYVLGLSNAEQHLLRAGALFHDVGNVVDRHRHHVISQETVERLRASGDLPFSAEEANVVGLLCRWHRTRETDFRADRVDRVGDERVRTGLLASILRVADAMDIDHRRSDYAEPFARVLKFFFPRELPYWTSLEEILGVRVRCVRGPDGGPDVVLQIIVEHETDDNMQIEMLRKDVSSTPFDWAIEVVAVQDGIPLGTTQPAARAALVVFPLEAHSVTMAGRSRSHLQAAGYTVEMLCYPDTIDGGRWLWDQGLTTIDPASQTRLVVIGDRHDLHAVGNRQRVIERWQAAGVQLSLFNRHEGNWQYTPRMLELGAAVTLGGDWSYFWGDAVTRADLAWGRIAAFCTRDPTQSTVGTTADEERLVQGLVVAVHAAVAQALDQGGDWTEAAEPLLARIAADDREWFAAQANSFSGTFTQAVMPSRADGRVLMFEDAQHATPQAAFWAMEAAIEQHGRAPVRGMHFNFPYAIAVWQDGNETEMLAISHWREEDAVPIRLLYPSEAGFTPEGHESVLRVRMPAAQSAPVVEALVAACNKVNYDPA